MNETVPIKKFVSHHEVSSYIVSFNVDGIEYYFDLAQIRSIVFKPNGYCAVFHLGTPESWEYGADVAEILKQAWIHYLNHGAFITSSFNVSLQ